MASNANFISQFVMGGDPCTYKESGELQAEMSKLTHPARPDVDWRQVEKLSLALFRQNGVELQTLVCYVLAITRRQGLAGMADGLGSLDILLQRWADFWPVQVHSRISLLSWVTEKNAAGTENAGYSVSGSAADLPLCTASFYHRNHAATV